MIHPVFQQIEGSGLSMPCLFYPAVRQCGLHVQQALQDGRAQAEVLLHIARTYPVAAVVRMTELWCEGASYGMDCRFSDTDFPVLGAPLCDEGEALAALSTPQAENEVTAPLLEAIRIAAPQLDRPLFAGMTGPYTLGTVLCGAEDFMVACMTEPDEVHAFLANAAGFLTDYALACKRAGAAGIFIAEPAVAMISPEMLTAFSNDYLQRIIAAVQDDRFAVVYHNCGAADPHMQTIAALDAAAFHFGSAVDLARARSLLRPEAALAGSLDPRVFLGKAEAVAAEAAQQSAACGALAHWVPSSGCDLSPAVTDEALAAYFASVRK